MFIFVCFLNVRKSELFSISAYLHFSCSGCTERLIPWSPLPALFCCMFGILLGLSLLQKVLTFSRVVDCACSNVVPNTGSCPLRLFLEMEKVEQSMFVLNLLLSSVHLRGKKSNECFPFKMLLGYKYFSFHTLRILPTSKLWAAPRFSSCVN